MHFLHIDGRKLLHEPKKVYFWHLDAAPHNSTLFWHTESAALFTTFFHGQDPFSLVEGAAWQCSDTVPLLKTVTESYHCLLPLNATV